jgi:hypothetical protein
MSAEALPAFWLNGAIESADALGNINPWQHKNINIRITVTYKLFNPNIDVAAKTIPTPFWMYKTILIMFSDENLRNIKLLN